MDNGQKHMPPLDMTATRLETPRLNEQEDLRAWQKSASNANAQLEHQHSRSAMHWGLCARCLHVITPLSVYCSCQNCSLLQSIRVCTELLLHE